MIPETKEFELPTTYKISPEVEGEEWSGTYKIEVLRHLAEGNKKVTVASVTSAKPSEVYVKLGQKVAELNVDPVEGIENAKRVIDEALSQYGTQTIIKADDFKNTLLDARQKLGGSNE